MREARHPKCNVRLLFDEGPHEYRMAAGDAFPDGWEEARPLPSVTQFVAHYSAPFDGDAIAARKAERDGRMQADVRAEWAEAAAMGTRVHAGQESLMNGAAPSEAPQSEREGRIMAAGAQAFHYITACGWVPLAAELMVFSPAYRLCGTVDAIFRRGREILIVDWKTNRRLHAHGYLGARMLPPASTLEDCCMSKYGLQLNLYQRILLHEGYIQSDSEPRKVIVHLTPDGFRDYPVSDMPEADRLLLDYLTGDWFAPAPPF